MAANGTAGPQVIGFHIPTTDPGFDGTAFTIKPQGIRLPPIGDDGTTIDGLTQSLFTGDTNPIGPEIILDGSESENASVPDHGIEIFGASDNLIRGLVIHSFPETGVQFIVDASTSSGVPNGNRITHCYIGTDETGTLAWGNGWEGVAVDGTGNIIGGTEPGEGNLISGNGLFLPAGVGMAGSENHVVGNLIGTDRTGTVALGNQGFGVIVGGGPNNIVGGSADGARNVISGNLDNGVVTDGFGNRIEGNFIGTDITGTSPLPNGPGGGTGVSIAEDSRHNVVIRNLIAFNHGAGVAVTQTAVYNTISQNRIVSNNMLGIDLGVPYHGDGVTPNDAGDADTGPNAFQNYPELTFAVAAPGQLIVRGKIDTTNPETVTLEFFANTVPSPGGDPSGHGEGAVYLGTSAPNSRGSFAVTLSPVDPGTLITATATDAQGNTSEFADNIEAQLPPIRP